MRSSRRRFRLYYLSLPRGLCLYSTILLALLLLLGRRLCRATYILCSSLLSSTRYPLLSLLLLSFITVRPEVWV